MQALLKGSYRDLLINARGGTLWDSEWRPNLVVQNSNLLLASLMKRQSGMSGILYWAVGEGDSGWDAAVPSPQPSNTQLTGEIARQAVDVEEITFLGEDGQPTTVPTGRLEITTQFLGDNFGDYFVEGGFQSLREFGLFGGDAVATPNSGFMIDQVIHPRIDLAPGMTLNRRLRLTFGSAGSPAIEDSELSLVIASLPVTSIDGVAATYTQALVGSGITTIGQLADFNLAGGVAGISLVKLREFRAKCRMALSLRIGFFPVQPIADRNISDVLRQSPQDLVEQMDTPGMNREMVEQLQSELDKLQVALDDSQLQSLTVGELVSAPS